MRSVDQFARILALYVVAAGLLGGGVTAASAQDMPDPSLIHGKALPAAELPVGTVTVRVVREAIGNNITGQQVRVTVNGTAHTTTTDSLGRAEFRGLPSGSEGRAESTVDGEQLVSDPFGVPTTGGLRVILVAGIARAAERRKQEEASELAAPAVKGVVVFGGNTRIVTEFQDDTLRVFYQLDIINSARSRVDIGGPLILDLPELASSAATLGAPTKQASVSGTRLTVTGPFNPGTTTVEVGFQLRYSGSEVAITQTWPLALQQWIVGVEKSGALTLASPQIELGADRAMEDGSVFVVANGKPLQAGSTTTIHLANLPSHSRVAADVAIAIALGLIGLGVWLSWSVRSRDAGARNALVGRRDALLTRLEELERSHRSGSIPGDRYLSRRQRLLADLEQIYGEIDESGIHPHGGGEGVAA